MASVRLFVYGSLKRGGRHHDELAGAVFLGPATTLPGYRLEPMGEYLALVAVPPPPQAEAHSGPQQAQPHPHAKAKAKAQEEAKAKAQEKAKAKAQPEPQPQPEPQAEAQPEHETDTGTATAVPGELFEVDEAKLQALDAFEGDAYERGNVRLVGARPQKPGFALAYFRKAR